jgi:hypothetical protein
MLRSNGRSNPQWVARVKEVWLSMSQYEEYAPPEPPSIELIPDDTTPETAKETRVQIINEHIIRRDFRDIAGNVFSFVHISGTASISWSSVSSDWTFAQLIITVGGPLWRTIFAATPTVTPTSMEGRPTAQTNFSPGWAVDETRWEIRTPSRLVLIAFLAKKGVSTLHRVNYHVDVDGLIL